MKKRYVSLFFLFILIFSLTLCAFAPCADETGGENGSPEEKEGEKEGEEAKEEKEEPDLREFADKIALWCVDTGTLLYEKNATARCAPSSSAKLMCALVAADLITDPEATVEVTSDMLRSVSGLIYGFKAGNTVSYDDLIAAMLIRNANDAALILSRALCSSQDEFISRMNGKAKELGMNDTKYTNPTGISGDSYTTVSDMLTLTLAFAKNNHLLALSGKSYYKLPSTGVTIYSRNFYLSKYYNAGRSYISKEVIGGITGQTEESGDTLITIAKHGGYTYACVLTNGVRDEENIYSYLTTSYLTEWAANSFEYRTLLSSSDVICNIGVVMGNGADETGVFPAVSVVRYILKDIDLERAVTYEYSLIKEELTAPVEYAEKVGTLTLSLDGDVIETVDLIVRSDIQSSSGDYIFNEVKNFITGKVFIRNVLIVLGVSVLYVLGMAIYRGQKQKRALAAPAAKSGESSSREAVKK